MENIVDHESRMVFWFSRTWIFLLALLWAGFMGGDGVPPGADVHRLGGENDIELVGRVAFSFSLLWWIRKRCITSRTQGNFTSPVAGSSCWDWPCRSLATAQPWSAMRRWPMSC